MFCTATVSEGLVNFRLATRRKQGYFGKIIKYDSMSLQGCEIVRDMTLLQKVRTSRNPAKNCVLVYAFVYEAAKFALFWIFYFFIAKSVLICERFTHGC